MYQVSVKPYYDSICQGYRQLLVVYPKPKGALLSIIKQLAPSKLSPFKQFSDCDPYPSCFYAILNPQNKCDFLRVDDIALLFCFLTENGYTINTQVTKIMMKAQTQIQDTLLFYIN